MASPRVQMGVGRVHESRRSINNNHARKLALVCGPYATAPRCPRIVYKLLHFSTCERTYQSDRRLFVQQPKGIRVWSKVQVVEQEPENQQTSPVVIYW
jgi:hypothetical protein